MHYRTLILAFALIVSTGFGSLMIGGGVPAPGGSGLTVLYTNNYELNGTDCEDSVSSDTCTLSGATIAAYTFPDGSYGLRVDNGGESYSTTITGNTNDLTMDFSFSLNSSGTPTNQPLFGLNNYECGVDVTDSGTVLSLGTLGSGLTAGDNEDISDSTNYYGRLAYRPATRDCSLYVWTGGYGTSLVTGFPSVASGGSSSSVTTVRGEWGSGQDIVFLMGETILCEGALSDPATDGRCDL